MPNKDHMTGTLTDQLRKNKDMNSRMERELNELSLSNELESVREELLQANRKLKKQESLASLSPQASDVDGQLSAIYLNLFAGVYSELIEGLDVSTETSGETRWSRLQDAHDDAMQIVALFRQEILHGKQTTDNNTEM